MYYDNGDYVEYVIKALIFYRFILQGIDQNREISSLFFFCLKKKGRPGPEEY